MNRFALLILCACLTSPAHAQHLSDSGGFVAGGGYETDHKAHQPCVPPAERARLAEVAPRVEVLDEGLRVEFLLGAPEEPLAAGRPLAFRLVRADADADADAGGR